MILRGMIKKGETHWLAEIAEIDLVTQGETRVEALAMMADAIVTLVDKPDFEAKVRDEYGDDEFGIQSDDTGSFMSLYLKRRTEKEMVS